MPTYALIRADGVPTHRHPTRDNTEGRLHGPWVRHDDDSHTIHNAAEPRWNNRGRWFWPSSEELELYLECLRTGRAPLTWRHDQTMRQASRSLSQHEIVVPDFFTVSNRRFGVEIECIGPETPLINAVIRRGVNIRDESYNHNDYEDHWKIVSDGSLTYSGRRRGFRTMEVVSSILRGENGLEQLRKVTEAMNEVNTLVNASCGLHVHHDANALTVDEIKRVVINYAHAQRAIDKMLAPSRRSVQSPRYARPYLPSDVDRVIRIETRQELGYMDRYRVVNLQALNAHGTLEFRQHQGTVEYSKIASWVEFGQTLVDKSVSGLIIPTDIEDPDDLLIRLDMPEQVSTMIKARVNELARE